MKDDTSRSVSIRLVEQGMRTLTHDWRNVLNGINLRIISACYLEEAPDRLEDLQDAKRLIAEATTELADLSRRLDDPEILPIPYPIVHFAEDLLIFLKKRFSAESSRLKWETTSAAGSVNIDFMVISQAIAELIENTFRYLPKDRPLSVLARAETDLLILSWTEPYTGTPPTEDWGRMPFFSTEKGHLGLGLYFAKRIIDGHRGSLSFDYSQEAEMLQTTVRLPTTSV